jgi:hypothetical protein
MNSLKNQIIKAIPIFCLIPFILFFSYGISDSKNPDLSQPGIPDRPDRAAPQLISLILDSGIRDLPRDSSTSYTLTLVKIPIITHIHARVFHQGTDVKPEVFVNGKKSGTLEPVWPSLKDRNYVFFIFDDNPEKTLDYQMDYNGWLDAHAFVQGWLLKPGENVITISVKDDAIKIKDVSVEILNELHRQEDSLSDCTDATLKRMMEEYERTGHIRH